MASDNELMNSARDLIQGVTESLDDHEKGEFPDVFPDGYHLSWACDNARDLLAILERMHRQAKGTQAPKDDACQSSSTS